MDAALIAPATTTASIAGFGAAAAGIAAEGAAGMAAELGMAAAWGAGGIAAGALGEAGASAIEGGTAGSTNAAGYGAGTPGSPMVTQPVNTPTQPSQNITIVLNNPIGERKWFEDNLPGIVKDFKSRNVDMGVQYA